MDNCTQVMLGNHGLMLQDMQDQFELLQGRLARRSNSVAALKQQLAASVSKCEGMSADNFAESAVAQVHTYAPLLIPFNTFPPSTPPPPPPQAPTLAPWCIPPSNPVSLLFPGYKPSSV